MRRAVPALWGTLLAGALALGCTLLGSAAAAALDGAAVSITNQGLTPNPVTVTVGQSVAWTNNDAVVRTVHVDATGFELALGPGESASIVFDSAGEQTYSCDGVTGTVQVLDSTTTTSTTSTSTTASTSTATAPATTVQASTTIGQSTTSRPPSNAPTGTPTTSPVRGAPTSPTTAAPRPVATTVAQSTSSAAGASTSLAGRPTPSVAGVAVSLPISLRGQRLAALGAADDPVPTIWLTPRASSAGNLPVGLLIGGAVIGAGLGIGGGFMAKRRGAARNPSHA